MVNIKMSNIAHNALRDAILAGALAQRHAQFTTLLGANTDHPSIVATYEKEISALEFAAHAVMGATNAS